MKPQEHTSEKSMTQSAKVGSNSKTSFAPLADDDTEILILGSMPGDRSLELGEYYGHPQNRFWRVISMLTTAELPISYADKKALLRRSRIGLWDVAHKANRKGSLDSAIRDEEPNDIATFISAHKQLRIIGFNGKFPEKLHDKYWSRHPDIEYISLPSTSPANAAFSVDLLCGSWQKIFIHRR
jgi:hypoxanthine-DNA glycosylase